MDTQITTKAQQLVLNLVEGKEELRDVKNALKAYKVTSEKLEQLKSERKKSTVLTISFSFSPRSQYSQFSVFIV